MAAHTKRWMVAVVGAVCSCALLAGPALGAATEGTATCTVTGSSNVVVPWYPPDGYTAPYEFEELAMRCAVEVEDPANPDKQFDVVTIDITSQGTFEGELICGRGTAVDTDPSIEVHSLSPGGDVVNEGDDLVRHIAANGGFGYRIDFAVFGMGTLDWLNPGLGPHPIAGVGTGGVISASSDPSSADPPGTPGSPGFCGRRVAVNGQLVAATD